MIKMESIKFRKPGRLVGKRNLPSVSYTPPTPTTDIQTTGYRETPTQDLPPVEEQHLTSLIIALLGLQKEAEDDWPQYGERCERLREIAKEMEKAGLMRTTDVQNKSGIGILRRGIS